MEQFRIDYLRRLTKEEKYNLTSKDFSVDEIVEILKKVPLSEENKRIAVKYYIECKDPQTISYEMYRDDRTIRKRLPKISHIIKSFLVVYFV